MHPQDVALGGAIPPLGAGPLFMPHQASA
jgi:hypothetical protein